MRVLDKRREGGLLFNSRVCQTAINGPVEVPRGMYGGGTSLYTISDAFERVGKKKKNLMRRG